MNTRRDSQRPRSASTASRNGVDMPKRMKALTIGGAVSSLETGGPRPQEMTTSPMTSNGSAPLAVCTGAVWWTGVTSNTAARFTGMARVPLPAVACWREPLTKARLRRSDRPIPCQPEIAPLLRREKP